MKSENIENNIKESQMFIEVFTAVPVSFSKYGTFFTSFLILNSPIGT